jgi:hypothetical protein
MTAWMYVSVSLCLSTHLMTTWMWITVSFCLSTHLYYCLNVCISVPLSVHTPYDYKNAHCPSVCPHTCMTAWTYVSLSLCLSTHLMTTKMHTVHLSFHTPAWLPECIYLYPFVCPHTLWLQEWTVSICLSIHLTIIWMYMPQCSFVFTLSKSEHMLHTVGSVLRESDSQEILAKIGDEIIWITCSIMTNLAKWASMIILSLFAY